MQIIKTNIDMLVFLILKKKKKYLSKPSSGLQGLQTNFLINLLLEVPPINPVVGKAVLHPTGSNLP